MFYLASQFTRQSGKTYVASASDLQPVKQDLEGYTEGVDYRLDGNIDAFPFENVAIWIV